MGAHPTLPKAITVLPETDTTLRAAFTDAHTRLLIPWCIAAVAGPQIPLVSPLHSWVTFITLLNSRVLRLPSAAVRKEYLAIQRNDCNLFLYDNPQFRISTDPCRSQQLSYMRRMIWSHLSEGSRCLLCDQCCPVTGRLCVTGHSGWFSRVLTPQNTAEERPLCFMLCEGQIADDCWGRSYVKRGYECLSFSTRLPVRYQVSNFGAACDKAWSCDCRPALAATCVV